MRMCLKNRQLRRITAISARSHTPQGGNLRADKAGVMRTMAAVKSTAKRRHQAFFLLEATIGMALLGLVFMALYTGLVSTTYSVHLSRENLRATQLMAEKLDTIRLYGWNKIADDPYYIQPKDEPLYSDDPSKPGNDATTRLYNVEILTEPA